MTERYVRQYLPEPLLMQHPAMAVGSALRLMAEALITDTSDLSTLRLTAHREDVLTDETDHLLLVLTVWDTP